MCECANVRWLVLEAAGLDAGDRVELGDAALGGGVKALRLSAHLEEHFLLLQLPGKLLLQGLRGKQVESCGQLYTGGLFFQGRCYHHSMSRN